MKILLIAVLAMIAKDFPHSEAESRDANESPSQHYCHAHNANPYLGFSLMTPYRFFSRESLNSDDVIPEGCTAVQVWQLIRPGSARPHVNDLQAMRSSAGLQMKIVESFRHGKGNMCHQDILNLGEWSVGDVPKVLSAEGEDEIRGYASRFQENFGHLLQQPNSYKLPGTGVELGVSYSRQSYVSASVFVDEAFGSEAEFVSPAQRLGDQILFYERCNKYIQQVLEVHDEERPYHKFMESEAMETVLMTVSYRLGINVTIRDVRFMYNTCRYNTAWNPGEVSPWCAVFTKNDLKVLEYWEDLRTYHDQGYGHEINYLQACKLGQDFMGHFRARVEKGKDDVTTTTYFPFEEAFLPFLAYLGLFKDEVALTEEYIPTNRQWRTSRFAGYGANLAFYLSSCENDGFWVSAVLNESPLLLPPCNSTLGCSWQTFAHHFGYLEDCDSQEICSFMSEGFTKRKQRQGLYKMNQWM